jgi:hypothetical protein
MSGVTDTGCVACLWMLYESTLYATASLSSKPMKTGITAVVGFTGSRPILKQAEVYYGVSFRSPCRVPGEVNERVQTLA